MIGACVDIHLDTPLNQQLFDIAVGQRIAQIPTHGQRDHIREDPDGLVRIENGGAMKSSRIVLTARGRARLGRNGT